MANPKIRFSRAALVALPLPEHGKRAYHGDLQEPGLLVMLTHTGVRTFQVYIKHEGRPVRVTLGRFNDALADSVELPRDCSHTRFLANNPELNVRMARELAAKVKIDLKAGTNPTDVKKARREELTLGELFEEFVSRHLIPKGRKGVDDTRGDFERLLGALPDTPRKKHGLVRMKSPGSVNWQNRRISSIGKADVQKLVADLAREGSPDNANRALVLLKSMYNRATELDLFKKGNPSDGIAKFKTKSRERFLQADELPRFFDSLAQEPNTDVSDFLIISLLTGVRKSNVLSMAWADINLARETWTVPGHLSKNGDPITIALVPAAVEVLKSRRPKRAARYVFPGDGVSGHMGDPRKGWERVLDRDELTQLVRRIEAATGEPYAMNFDDPTKPHFQRLASALKAARVRASELGVDTTGARLEDLRPHDLRRTLGSWQAATGASLLVIGKSLGHRDSSSTQIYSRLSMDPVRSSLNTATSAMLAAAGRGQSAAVSDILKAKRRKGQE